MVGFRLAALCAVISAVAYVVIGQTTVSNSSKTCPAQQSYTDVSKHANIANDTYSLHVRMSVFPKTNE